LKASLRQRGIDWIEDPSNASLRFERVRWRSRPGAAADLPAVLDAVREAGIARDQMEREAAAWLACHGRIDAAGYAVLDRLALKAAPTAVVQSVLRDTMYTIGAADFTLPSDKLAIVLAQFDAAVKGALTLGGCHVEWSDKKVAVYREAAGCEVLRHVQPDKIVLWDRRYRVNLMGPLTGNPGSWSLAAIGEWGLANRPAPQDVLSLPFRARQALPALWRDGEVAVWPRLARDEVAMATAGQNVAVPESREFPRLDVAFLPRRGPTSCGFPVVRPQKRIM
jgi:tRNA(Ile)-lysidine synthase